MEGRGTGRLTEPQRIALRLFMERKTAKQIALELGISPKAVELRLKGAREALGASTSADAARLLAADEQYAAFRETLGGSTEVADRAVVMPPAVIDSGAAGAGEAGGRRGSGEAQAAIVHEPGRWPKGFEWPLPSGEGRRNDLSFGARLIWPFLAIFAIGVSIGTLVICGSLLALASTAVLRLLR